MDGTGGEGGDGGEIGGAGGVSGGGGGNDGGRQSMTPSRHEVGHEKMRRAICGGAKKTGATWAQR